MNEMQDLDSAIRSGNNELVKSVIRAGAQPTPESLTLAILYGEETIVNSVLEAGAQLTRDAIILSIKSQNSKIAHCITAELKRMNLIQKLFSPLCEFLLVMNTESCDFLLKEIIQLIGLIFLEEHKNQFPTEISQEIAKQLSEKIFKSYNIPINFSTEEALELIIDTNDPDILSLALAVNPQMMPQIHDLAHVLKYVLKNHLFGDGLRILKQGNILTNDNVETLLLYIRKNLSGKGCVNIAKCLISLHQADLISTDNRNAIIDRDKSRYCAEIVDGLIKLKETDLLTDGNRLAIIENPSCCKEIVDSLIKLKVSDLLTDSNCLAMIANPSCCKEIIDGLIKLKELDLLTDDTCKAIIVNPSDWKKLTEGLTKLKESGLWAEGNRQAIINTPSFSYKQIIDGLVKLSEAGALSASARQLLVFYPSPYMVEKIINLHNEGILEEYTSLILEVGEECAFSVAIGLVRLRQADLLTEECKSLMLVCKEDAGETAYWLGELKKQGYLSEDTIQLICKYPKKAHCIIADLAGLASAGKIFNPEDIKQFIICYDDWRGFKKCGLTVENFYELIQQTDLTSAIGRPGFSDALKLLKEIKSFTIENIFAFIRQKDIVLAVEGIYGLVGKNVLNKGNYRTYIQRVLRTKCIVSEINRINECIEKEDKSKAVDKDVSLVVDQDALTLSQNKSSFFSAAPTSSAGFQETNQEKEFEVETGTRPNGQ